MDNNIIETLDWVGLFGPLIIFIITIFSLWKQEKYLIVYLIFSIVNSYFNLFLKLLIREPRPKGNIYTENDTGADKYGMPSRHAQEVFFSIAFMYLVKQKITTYFMLALFVCIMSLIQRYKYKKHTIKQLFVGSLVGIGFAFISYKMMT